MSPGIGSPDEREANPQSVAAKLAGRNVVVVSNRQPYSHEHDGDAITVSRPAGGLTSALDPVLQSLSGTWVAWGSGDADREVVDERDVVGVPPESPSYDLRRVWLTDEQVEGYYYGYSNQVLWPLCHLLGARATFADEFWDHYRTANRAFADAVIEAADPGALVWFQDYHLALAPRHVREAVSDDAFLTHFWHIPWPSWDAFHSCPQYRELVSGLLANDLLGFHTTDYCKHFLECAGEAVDADVDWTTGSVEHEGQVTYVRAFPLGIDADAFEQRARSAEADEFWAEFSAEHGLAGRKIALGVDRLDYTKGIVERLRALERLWEDHPEWRGELTYVQKATETRSRIDQYREFQAEVEGTVAEINERFGTDDWHPIRYCKGMFSQVGLAALYREADLALVSPVKDGMNLVAKEYVASQVDEDGVLVLSELAGASERLGRHALLIHPNDTEGFADAIERALTMPRVERRRRMRALRADVARNDVYNWIDDVFDTVRTIEHSRRDHPPLTSGRSLASDDR